jgi:hypothetical protein
VCVNAGLRFTMFKMFSLLPPVSSFIIIGLHEM